MLDEGLDHPVPPHRARCHEQLVLLHSVQERLERPHNLWEECQEGPSGGRGGTGPGAATLGLQCSYFAGWEGWGRGLPSQRRKPSLFCLLLVVALIHSSLVAWLSPGRKPQCIIHGKSSIVSKPGVKEARKLS